MERRAASGFYERWVKRPFDILCALMAMIVFSWLYLLVAVLVRINLGTPVIFCQERPGKDEKIFKLYKFRSMTDERDENGKLLPDEMRLTKFGKFLRSTSMDELPEAWNILKGDMSVVGPRPQLVRDVVFMTAEQRRRHLVRPGLTGLAQVNGRNAVRWEVKLALDLKYMEHISFWGDMKIIFKTVGKVFRREDIAAEDMDTAEDYGDYLLRMGIIQQDEYANRQEEARELIAAR